MKNRFARMLIIMAFLFAGLGFRTGTAIATVVGCNGNNCKGKNPNSMGCPAARAGTPVTLPDGLSTAETRVSPAGTSSCDAKWARVYNLSGSSQWVAADIKCGDPSYKTCQFQASGGKIASSATVGIYTMMTPFAATKTRSCGVVRADPGPITTVPLGGPNCTGVN